MKQSEFIAYITTLIGEFGYLLPEMTLIAGSLFLVVLDLLYKGTAAATVRTLATLVVLAATSLAIDAAPIEGAYLNGVLAQTAVTPTLKYFFVLMTAAVLLYPNSRVQRRTGEYQYLILMVLLGAFFLIQAQNLLLFYVALELVSITSYVLIAFSFQRKGFEAGIKYLLFGAMSSGLMLYGLSLIYGLSGSLDLAVIPQMVAQSSDPTWLNLALMLFFVGIFFKLALVPFHIWSPDAYEAGPTAAIALISVLPKVAILVFFYQFTQLLDTTDVELFNWQYALSILAIGSMFVGNLSALRQNNAKRMMAYSSIAHAGTLLIGVIVGTAFGYEAMLFYAVVYGVMNVGVFYFIDWMEKNELENISDLAGLGRQFPAVGVCMTVLLVSLVGLPPTGGFSAKLLVFSSLWDVYLQSADSYLLWLFALGILNSAISLFYYLKIPYYLFLKTTNSTQRYRVGAVSVVFLACTALLVLATFFMADLLLEMLF
ncbi:NADH-quinone oxidoreductase subunit N [Reichenbachiella agariperforans]|uniref:NADH-quinone oxidoreductase subunit N n=1 Tax=Reichenbachiella agariperforans TaxID=156994 RepID=UPI001C09F652|nr:NADH-quinone oxidoreductase subunit N [Reichenbachiella agariperforans]MBU2914354.1 NADH-quinone oxidoreductase subunit N [Reichenbachiella agariperforans]